MAHAAPSHRWVWCAGLVLLTALWYGPFVDGAWVYEDAHVVARVDEPVHTWAPPSRALTTATYHWTWQIAGREPALYRLGNLALHLTAGVLVYAVASALVPGAAVWSAGIFLLHPLNSEAVRYVSARSDLLLTVCVLLATWISLGRVSVWRTGLLGLALLGASMSKELGLGAIPLVAITVLVWRPQAVATTMIAPLWIALGALVGATLPILLPWLTLSPTNGSGTFFTWPAFALLQLTNVWSLVSRIPWTTGFSIDHDVIGLGPTWTLAAVLLTGLASGLVAWTWRRAPVVAWGLLWLAVAVLPRFLFRTNEFLTEPQLSTAMVGLSVLAGAGITAVLAWRPSSTWAAGPELA